VDEVFHPDAAAFYPPGFQTHIEVTEVSQGLCGARRPGHFRGVATVVYRLFQLLQPDVALFGDKDFQQLRVIQRMTSDLGLPIEVIGRPIVRESDGLAMSSRNTYLSALDRPRALALSRGLRAAQAAFAKGERGPQALVALARQPVQAAELREDYVELCDPETLKPLASTTQATPDSRLLVAAFVGKTRLIDNVRLGG
jgi:pantoate--beta-alanine ligase